MLCSGNNVLYRGRLNDVNISWVSLFVQVDVNMYTCLWYPQVWNEVWSRGHIDVTGNKELSQDIGSAMYNILSSVPDNDDTITEFYGLSPGMVVSTYCSIPLRKKRYGTIINIIIVGSLSHATIDTCVFQVFKTFPVLQAITINCTYAVHTKVSQLVWWLMVQCFSSFLILQVVFHAVVSLFHPCQAAVTTTMPVMCSGIWTRGCSHQSCCSILTWRDVWLALGHVFLVRQRRTLMRRGLREPSFHGNKPRQVRSTHARVCWQSEPRGHVWFRKFPKVNVNMYCFESTRLHTTCI